MLFGGTQAWAAIIADGKMQGGRIARLTHLGSYAKVCTMLSPYTLTEPTGIARGAGLEAGGV